jgi:hypothetical protein
MKFFIAKNSDPDPNKDSTIETPLKSNLFMGPILSSNKHFYIARAKRAIILLITSERIVFRKFLKACSKRYFMIVSQFSSCLSLIKWCENLSQWVENISSFILLWISPLPSNSLQYFLRQDSFIMPVFLTHWVKIAGNSVFWKQKKTPWFSVLLRMSGSAL